MLGHVVGDLRRPPRVVPTEDATPSVHYVYPTMGQPMSAPAVTDIVVQHDAVAAILVLFGLVFDPLDAQLVSCFNFIFHNAVNFIFHNTVNIVDVVVYVISVIGWPRGVHQGTA